MTEQEQLLGGRIILEGVTGSKAYGLDTPESDEDIKGVYLLPTDKVLSLGFNRDKTTKDHTDPDWVYHELEKFMHLAMKGNPTITEMLWLNDYTKLSPEGQLLVDNRELFLNNVVYKSYGGYALSQARKLNARGSSYSSALKNRKAKHTRHCYRLLMQGKELLETGKLTVRVTPEEREYLFWIGEQPVEVILEEFERQFKEFDKIPSVLPEEPDYDKINNLLLQIRKAN